MRFDSPIRYLKIYMRMGVATVVSDTSVMPLTRLDPALIGKTMHSLAVTYPPVRGWPRLRRELDLDGAIGVDDPDEFARTTAEIFLTSEGDEARLSIDEPRESSEVEQSFMDLTPMLSTTPPLRLPPESTIRFPGVTVISGYQTKARTHIRSCLVLQSLYDYQR